jgi:hypothetical protein
VNEDLTLDERLIVGDYDSVRPHEGPAYLVVEYTFPGNLYRFELNELDRLQAYLLDPMWGPGKSYKIHLVGYVVDITDTFKQVKQIKD